MSTVSVTPSKRKIIDLKDDTFKTLSIMAIQKGTNLKNYIEDILNGIAEDYEDAKLYAKWQEMRINGIKTEDIKIYILKCSRTRTWLKEVFEKGGLKTICLGNVDIKSNTSLKDALVNCINKKYRAVLLGKDIYVVKPTTSKNFKLDGEIPKNSYPYDLHNFNIHYSYIPEELVNE